MGKVGLIASQPEEKIRQTLHEPFSNITYKREGEVLGNTYVGNKPLLATNARLRKAKTACIMGTIQETLYPH